MEGMTAAGNVGLLRSHDQNKQLEIFSHPPNGPGSRQPTQAAIKVGLPEGCGDEGALRLEAPELPGIAGFF
jgi:hypothetical protein